MCAQRERVTTPAATVDSLDIGVGVLELPIDHFCDVLEGNILQLLHQVLDEIVLDRNEVVVT